VADGEKVRVEGPGGSSEAFVKPDWAVPAGAVKLSNHFESAGAYGLLGSPVLDPVTKAPALEGCMVRIQPLKGGS
jgi:anaerobic selenocysteine-containing dehydrogenase